MVDHLIIGGDGAIGSRLSELFSLKGGAVLKTSRRRDCLSGKTVFLDLKTLEGMELLSFEFGKAYFCTGISDTGECREDEVGTRQVNVDSTIRLMEALASKGTKIVFLSSSMVFDGSTDRPNWDEALRPMTAYGRQKAEVESWMAENLDRYAIVRLGKVLGVSFPLFERWAEAFRRGEVVEAFDDWRFSPVDLASVVGVLPIIASISDRGIYHLGSDGCCSYYQAACLLAKWLGLADSKVMGTRINESQFDPEWIPRFASLNCRSEHEVLGWHCEKPESVLERYFDTRIPRKIK